MPYNLISYSGLGASANLYTWYHEFKATNPLIDLSISGHNLISNTDTPSDYLWNHEFNSLNPLADSSINSHTLLLMP